MTTFLLVIVFVFISLVCNFFLYLYMLVFLYVLIAGLQCISMLPELSSCKVLMFVVLRKFLTDCIIFNNKDIFAQSNVESH